MLAKLGFCNTPHPFCTAMYGIAFFWTQCLIDFMLVGNVIVLCLAFLKHAQMMASSPESVQHSHYMPFPPTKVEDVPIVVCLCREF
jgi:hypothetical protein